MFWLGLGGRVMIVDAGNPRNGVSEHLHGYLTRDGESPAQLLAAGRKEVLEYGGEMTTGTAIRIERTDDGGFLVQTGRDCVAGGADCSGGHWFT